MKSADLMGLSEGAGEPSLLSGHQSQWRGNVSKEESGTNVVSIQEELVLVAHYCCQGPGEEQDIQQRLQTFQFSAMPEESQSVQRHGQQEKMSCQKLG